MEDLIVMEKKKGGRPKKVRIEDLVTEAQELAKVKELEKPVEEFVYSYENFRKNIDDFINEKPVESSTVRLLKKFQNR